MATNRFTQLAYSNLNENLPLLSLPFEQLQGVLSASQQAKDQFDELSGLTPKYIQNSPSDVKLAGTVKQYQNDVAAQLAEIAQSGDANKYRRELANARKNIVKMWQPGGAANALETRYAEDLKDKETVRKAFESAPRIGEYILGTKQYNDVNYNAAQGTYSNVSRSTYHRNIEEKEINDWFDKNLGNVKDSLLNEGYSRKQIDGITTMHDFWKTEGVPFNKLVDTFTKLFPQEFASSIYQREAANRYYNPSLPQISPNLFQTEIKDGKEVYKYDEYGNYMMDENNPIAQMIEGYAQLGTRRNITHDRKFDDNEIALENHKSALKKQENQEQWRMLNTLTVGNTGGVPGMNLNIDDKGNIIETGSQLKGKSNNPLGGNMVDFTVTPTVAKSTSFISAIQSGELEKKYPGVQDLYSRFSKGDAFKNLSPKQQATYMQEQYNKLSQQQKTTDFTVYAPSDEKTLKNANAVLIGSQGRPGQIAQQTIYAFDPSKGIAGKPMSFTEMLNQYGLSSEDWTKSASFYGNATSSNPLQPSGNIITLVDKKNNVVTIFASPESIAKESIKTPGYIASAPMYTAAKESQTFYTGIPEFDGQVKGGFKTRRLEVFASDQLEAQKDQLTNMWLNGKLSQKEYNNQVRDIETNLDKLYRSPKENALLRVGIELISPTGEPINLSDSKGRTYSSEESATILLRNIEQKGLNNE